MINADFVKWLILQEPVAQLIGDRAYPQLASQGKALPYVTFVDVFDAPVNCTTGATGYVEKRLQVDCWAEGYAVAKRLALRIRGAMNGFSGLWGQTTIHHCLQDGGEIDQHEPPQSGGEKGKHRIILEFNVAYQASGE